MMAESGAHKYTTHSSSILVRLGDKAWEIHPDGDKENRFTGEETSAVTPEDSRKVYMSSEAVREAVRKTVASTNDRRLQVPSGQFGRVPRFANAPWKALMMWVAKLAASVVYTLFPRKGNRSLAALQGGLSVGMVFGCIAMFLFHQMSPAAAADLENTKTTKPQSTHVAAMTTPTRALNLPGNHVYFVTLGTYATEAKAKAAAASAGKQGVSATVVPMNGYAVVASGAVVEADANALAAQLRKSHLNANVASVVETARPIQVLGNADGSTITATQRWLAQTSSGLLALDTWLSDHGRVVDAQTALALAIKSYPGDAAVAETGIGSQLMALQASLQSANQAFLQRNQTNSMKYLIKSLIELKNLQGIN